MARPEDPFVVVPVSRLPAEVDGADLAAQIQFIRDRIVGKTNEEIIDDNEAMKLLAEIGPDQNILAYAFNFKNSSGQVNTDLAQTNRLNKALYDRLSIDPGNDIYGYDLIVSTTDLNAAQYGDIFINDYKHRLGVGKSSGASIVVLRSVVMDPWVTETTKGSFLDILENEFRKAVTEVSAIKQFLAHQDACLLVCPQHDVGSQDDPSSHEVEFLHHGDRQVPAQQRIGGFARSILAELAFPIENQFGLNPAKSSIDNSPAPLLKFSELDDLNILQGVTTFNLHAHLPHYFVPDFLKNSVRILAKQSIDPAASTHPFVEAGNSAFNALLWIPPSGDLRANIFVCDSTLWSSAFGGVSSLELFWKNLALMSKV